MQFNHEVGLKILSWASCQNTNAPTVAANRVVRRCDNETHSSVWPFGNSTLPSEAHGSVGPGIITAEPSAGHPFSRPCDGYGYGGFPCYPTGTSRPAAETTDAFNSSWTQPGTNDSSSSASQSFNIGPDISSTPASPSNQSVVSTTGEIPSPSGASPSGNVTVNSAAFAPVNQSAEPVATQFNATLASESSSYVEMTTLTTNATSISTAIVSFNQTRTPGPLQTLTSTCLGSLGSICTPVNGTSVVPDLGTGGTSPRWTNTSSYASQSASLTLDTPSHITSEIVATLTLGVTPSPEVVTLTATVDVGGFQTSSRAGENTTERANTISAATSSSLQAGLITMTIVVASNSTGLIPIPIQTSAPLANLSDVGPASTLAPETSNASSISGNSTTLTNTPIATPASETTSAVSVPLATTRTDKSTLTFQNGTLATPTTTSSPYWSNNTSSTPCVWVASAGNPLWRDWNMTISSIFRDDNGSSSAEPTAGSSTEIAATSSTPETTSSTATSAVSEPTLSLASSQDINSTSTSPSNSSQPQVTTTALEGSANTSSSSEVQMVSSTQSGQVLPTSLNNPNASTICNINATVATCPSTAAPWLSTAAVSGTAGASGGTTLTTAFVSPSNGSFPNVNATLVPLKQVHVRSVRENLALDAPPATHDDGNARMQKVRRRDLEEK